MLHIFLISLLPHSLYLYLNLFHSSQTSDSPTSLLHSQMIISPSTSQTKQKLPEGSSLNLPLLSTHCSPRVGPSSSYYDRTAMPPLLSGSHSLLPSPNLAAFTLPSLSSIVNLSLTAGTFPTAIRLAQAIFSHLQPTNPTTENSIHFQLFSFFSSQPNFLRFVKTCWLCFLSNYSQSGIWLSWLESWLHIWRMAWIHTRQLCDRLILGD